jgi:cupin 2 domain-containing protein
MDLNLLKNYSFLENIPNESKEEIFETIVKNENVKIERIISYGQTSPENFWYDQAEDEFVLVLEGEAGVEYESGFSCTLKKGDSLYIDAHQKHRVTHTSNPTIWLAVFIVK